MTTLPPTAPRTPEADERAVLVRFLLVALGLPALIVALRSSGSPAAPFLTAHLSLTTLPAGVQGTLGNVLLVPLGALVVVVCRLVLGVRVLGPFRAILLAFGFMATGVATGIAFTALTVGTLLLVRPLVAAMRLPYFGRVSVMLSTVAMLLVGGALVGTMLGSQAIADTSHFPIVVLCLIGEAVARAIRKEGTAAGLSRAAMTAVVAVAVAAIASVPGLHALLAGHPELLLAQTGLIALVSRFCGWRLLQRLPRTLPLPRIPAPAQS